MELSGIILIVYILFFSLANASASYFLDKTFDEGMIFEKWRPFLAKVLLGKRVHEIGIQKGTPAYIDALKDKASEETFWYKPLGGCVICFSIWLSVPMYLLCIYLFRMEFSTTSHLIVWLFYATISNFMVRKMIGD